MRNQRLTKHLILAVVSFACPIIALSATLAYERIAYADFWHSITPEENFAGAMMAFAEVVQAIVFFMFGCLVGLIFAVLSMCLKGRVLGVGLAALVFNVLPFLLLISLLVGRMASGQ